MGVAIVGRFVEEGARVAAVDIDEAGLKAIEAKHGKEAIAIVADHTSLADCARVLQGVADRWGSLDILYNNAGRGFTGAFADTDEARLRQMIDADLIGPALLTRTALPMLREAAKRNPDGAVVLFTASVLGLNSRRDVSAYAIAKHGVIGLMRSLAKELGKENIRSNAICPGFVPTPMTLNTTDKWGSYDQVTEFFKNETPLPRLTQPIDIANAAVFLASDAARCIHGHCLVVDGGALGR
jgi:3-oxoacyl-[acyl-carrier protein] reductase